MSLNNFLIIKSSTREKRFEEAKLKIKIEACKKKNKALPNIGLLGPAGIGKTTLAEIIANELDADGKTGFTNTGALLGVELAVDTIIFAGAGSSAATGGTVKAAVWYIMSDDGSA